MNNNKAFFYKDKSGRGYNGTFRTENILIIVGEDVLDWNDQHIQDYTDEAEIGDTWETETKLITRVL